MPDRPQRWVDLAAAPCAPWRRGGSPVGRRYAGAPSRRAPGWLLTAAGVLAGASLAGGVVWIARLLWCYLTFQ